MILDFISSTPIPIPFGSTHEMACAMVRWSAPRVPELSTVPSRVFLRYRNSNVRARCPWGSACAHDRAYHSVASKRRVPKVPARPQREETRAHPMVHIFLEVIQ